MSISELLLDGILPCLCCSFLVFCASNFPRIDCGSFATLVLLVVCSYHVTHAFQSESTLYSCLNVKELLAQNRREI